MKWNDTQQKLQKAGLGIFTSREFRRAVGLTPAATKFLLIRQVKRGAVRQLKKRRGLYSLAEASLHPFVLANRLYGPSYVSLESAMAHYGLLPETVYGVTSVTPRVTRSFESMGQMFTYQKIKQSAFGDHESLILDKQTVHIASPGKALADYLYLAFLKARAINDRIRWKAVPKREILRCLKRFGRPALVVWGRNVIP